MFQYVLLQLHMNVYGAEARGRKREARGGRKGGGGVEVRKRGGARDEGKEEASERESRRAPCRS
jgi:hypothetical protein